MPLIVVSALCASLFMDNLTDAANDERALRDVCRERHTWIVSFLYIGTFGSFIGFGFAFGQVLLVQFAGDFDTPVKAAYLTFLGPLLGSLVRPVGGRLADRLGGSAGDVLELRGDGRRRGGRAAGVDARVAAAVPGRLRDPVRAHRPRQRLDLQDDPGHLPGQGRPRRRATAPTPTTRPAGPGGCRGR